VFVVRAKVGDSDRGWLALVDTVENRVEDGREMVNQCAALLTIALDLRDQEEQLMREAQSDRLTGLPNRSSFVASLEAAITRRRTTTGRPSCSSSISTGSSGSTTRWAITPATVCWSASPTGSGSACAARTWPARFGGDEFLVLLDDVAPGPVLDELVDRIQRRDLRALPPRRTDRPRRREHRRRRVRRRRHRRAPPAGGGQLPARCTASSRPPGGRYRSARGNRTRQGRPGGGRLSSAMAWQRTSVRA
jgi:GGDEF domain-containing protein